MRRKIGKGFGIKACVLAVAVLLSGCENPTKGFVADEETQQTDTVGKLSGQEDTGAGAGQETEQKAGQQASGEGSVTDFAENWSTAVDAPITVKKLTGVSEDFIYGVDVSSFLAERASGVKYYDYDGQELDDQGFFDFLAECGVNTIRIRVWNDPVDKDGHSYGGGNNDAATATELGLLATKAGMKVLLDFHYSDFWADPGKQTAPKAWEGLDIEAKAAALAEYTADTLGDMVRAGVDVDIVQIGNEITNGLAGETNWANKCALLNAAVKGIGTVEQSTGKDYRVAVHFTNPENGKYSFFAQNLKNFNVEYDIFASSYYSYWHGTTENLTNELSKIAQTYGKDVMVVETSYIYTYEDGDGSGNTESEGKAGDKFNYAVSEQGQADAVYAVADAVRRCGSAGIGICYWEPAWIPVNVYDSKADNAASVLAANREAWEKDGSGWAASYAGEYDTDAAEYYGGSAVDNEAWFDFWGKPLASARIYSYLKTGAKAPLQATFASCEDVKVAIGGQLVLPEKAMVRYNDGSTTEESIEWEEDAVAAVDTKGKGAYTVKGTVLVDKEEMEAPVTFEVVCAVTVEPENLLRNPGFEEDDMSMWEISSDAISRKNDSNNVRSGDWTLHFWSNSEITYTVSQKLTLPAGTYTFGGYLEGGDVGSDAAFSICVKVGGQEYKAEAMVTKWQEWKNPKITDIKITEDTEVTVELNGKAAAKGWGAWDDMYLYAQ